MKVTAIPGDGVGPEINEVMRNCVDSVANINWDIQENIEDAIDSIKKTKVAIKGPITTPVGKGFRSLNVHLRKILDLYAGVRPCKIYKGVKSRYEKVDLVIIRENTEDLYSGIEFKGSKARKISKEINPGSAVSIKVNSFRASKRIAKFAFEYAKKNKRNKITAVHKANILKYSDGLFLKSVQSVAKKYRIKFEDRIVDNMCMQLVQKPEQYDMLLCPNLYGDILSDLSAGLVGGLGVVPGANFGDKYAVFESVHGSAPKYTGKNKVNPTAIILSAAMMLRHIGKEKAGNKLEKATADVIKDGKKVTYDLGGKTGTKQMAEAIINKL